MNAKFPIPQGNDKNRNIISQSDITNLEFRIPKHNVYSCRSCLTVLMLKNLQYIDFYVCLHHLKFYLHFHVYLAIGIVVFIFMKSFNFETYLPWKRRDHGLTIML